ncbi:uncharacterized protein LOC123268641 [Cotesia glomerata]|uniref:Ig-like domain-containing protein n=1 Tax=Cotesia glomerata TaxID=32391 RepID=A0AAV7I7T4_COTGL|nr:uncharacterized protein LOC123268641 [Cotesia glomerata]KAH0546251.1 hypothetical protein KQX54_007541 [Cotesia glomerata]
MEMLFKNFFIVLIIINIHLTYGRATEASTNASTFGSTTPSVVTLVTEGPEFSPESQFDGNNYEDNNSASSVVFVDVPQHTETTLGTSVLLACRTAHPVVDCQWSWQPLPPVNLPLPDINPSNSNETTREILQVSTEAVFSPPTTANTQSLPVRQFPAFGNNSNDCSVRFTNYKYEQVGYWTCAARTTVNTSFVSTLPAKLSIAAHTPVTEEPIKFLEPDDAIEAAPSSQFEIPCRTLSPVSECQWSWRLANQTELWNIEMNKFPSFGENNTDCTIKIPSALPELEGLWTCGVLSDSAQNSSGFVVNRPIKLLLSEVEFIQLSRGIQTALGESALLRCQVNKPVVQCEWSWKPLNSSKEPMVIKNFVPNDDNKHDCSVRFKNVLEEEEGLWTCAVRLTSHGRLHEAAPAKLTLLPSAKINFTEAPENMSVTVSSHQLLKCVANTRVEKCTWLWKSLNDDGEVVAKDSFPSYGSLGINCSLNLKAIRMEDQGYWACQAIAPNNVILSSPYAEIIVYKQEKVEFSELLQDIQISSGSSVYLRCVTSSQVEQCRWSLTPVNSNTTVVVKQFKPVVPAGRDCSVRLSHALAEQEGLWTCGVKVHGTETYMNAPPAKLSLLEPEPVRVAITTNTHEIVTLGCKLYPLPSDTTCQWAHDLKDKKRTNATHKLRQGVLMNHTSGICTIQFKPDVNDLGLWTCKFIIKTDKGNFVLGNSSLTLVIKYTEDQRLGWIVGAATTFVLFLMILAVVLIVWRARLFTMESTRIFETAPLREKNQEDRKDSVDLELADTRLSVHSSSNSVLSRNSTFLGNADKYQHPR